jgi:regulator of protease activity HflC (stomatin/prohibitin superfamily)
VHAVSARRIAVPPLAQGKSDLVDQYFVRVRNEEGRVSAVLVDGVLTRVFGPGEIALFWKGPRKVEVMGFDAVAEPQVDARLVPAVIRFGAGNARAHLVTVPDQHVALVSQNGKLLRWLGSGTHAFWTALGPVTSQLTDLRRQSIEVNAQEILTKDKVTIRVNILAEYRITDPARSASVVRNTQETLYKLLQLAVRRTLGTRTLDEILQEKVEVDAASAEAIRTEMLEAGVEVGAIALKDVILPGEIREILNQVVAAEKQAQANLIRRREETAATRSLLNTARLMEDSPILLRLKELETLEKLTEKVGSVTVTGGFEGMLDKLLVPLKK